MATIEIKVPDIGDFAEVTVIELLVKPGDTIKPEQSLITVESDKASMEIPSSQGGVVKELKIKLGDKVKEGTVLLLLEAAGAQASSAPAPAASPATAQVAPVAAAVAAAPAPAASSFGGSADIECDLLVLGAGPGGYVSAIRCAQLGLKTAIVEGRETLGGTCLNVGCIPSKAMLHATEMLHEAEHNFAEMGLKGKAPSVDWKQMLTYKVNVVGQNTGGIEFLMKKNKITWIKGWASIPAAGQVKVGDDVHEAKHIIVASGSEPASLKGVEVDEKTVVTSTGALELGKIPKSLVVIGAGVIGLELGSVYARLGADVTVIEFLDTITPGMDADVVRAFKRTLEKQGLKFIMGAAVQGTEIKNNKLVLVPKSAHLPQEEQPNVFNSEVTSWIKGSLLK